jgi:CBS domain-containing protein
VNPLRELIRDSLVMDLGPLPAPRLAPRATVYQALQFLLRGRRGAVVAVEGARPVGIFTERDVLIRLPEGLFALRDRLRTAPLDEVMSKPPLTVKRQETLLEAIRSMARNGCRHLVVVDREGALRGLLTSSDIVQHLTDQFPEETLNLPPHLDQQYRSPEGA